MPDRSAARNIRAFPCVDVGLTQGGAQPRGTAMNGIIYLVGLIVVVLFILSFLGLR
jgi:hypothetical protein